VKRKNLTQKGIILSGRARVPVPKPSWQGLALVTILSLSAFLDLFRLTSEGYGNPYYAAAVKNMLVSWRNFFFVSFDAGFVSVDKPPLGLWIQAASAKLFGFHGWSLLLPQALAGVLCVALLYYLVRRAFGPVAGLIAAFALAVTPISVVTSRNNTMDMLLVLTVLVAAWAVTRAVETGRLRWLLVGAFVVGLGFNIKMLQVFLILPAFYLLYLAAAPLSWGRRCVHLGAATVVLVVVSLSWAVVVDLTPADQRPYVRGSSNNTVMDLIFGWNGAARLLGGGAVPAEEGGAADVQSTQLPSDSQRSPRVGFQGGPPGSDPGGIGENGEREPFRLLNQHLAGQIGWLLPLALVGLLAASWQRRPRLLLDRRQQALLLWGTWLLTQVMFFSFAGTFHRYYLVMLAPAIAALVGVGVVTLWNDYRSSGWRGWLLPLMLVSMSALHVHILADYPDWSGRLTPVIVGLCLVAVVVLVVLRLRPRPKAGAYAAGAVTVGILALLIGPMVWATIPLGKKDAMRATMIPFAGPDVPRNRPVPTRPLAFPGGAGLQAGNSPLTAVDPAMMNYLQANQGSARFLLAASNVIFAAPIILQTDESVISIGAFMAREPVLSAAELAGLAEEGAVRFFLVPDEERMMEMMSGYLSSQPSAQQGSPQGSPGEERGFSQNETTSWVQDNCQQVPRELWQSSTTSSDQVEDPMLRLQALYDCGTGGQ
jgi:4-amino-4-deoxy-L-arabinose transferase-like glycosyltransferase